MTATVSNHADIALRAYFIWDGEGRPHGRHQDHWFAAEAGLTHVAVLEAVEAAPATTAKAAPVKKPSPARKPAAAKKAAPAKVAAPKAPAETVVAAAALAKTPRATRSRAKGASSTH